MVILKMFVLKIVSTFRSFDGEGCFKEKYNRVKKYLKPVILMGNILSCKISPIFLETLSDFNSTWARCIMAIIKQLPLNGVLIYLICPSSVTQ